ncbi:MAG: hypothetical protein RLZZ450_3526 [Pseudomonadota bacterium]|jgi:hypothetical protein
MYPMQSFLSSLARPRARFDLTGLRVRSPLAHEEPQREDQSGVRSRAPERAFALGLRGTVLLSLAVFIALSLAQAPARANAEGQRLSVLRAAAVGVDPAQAAIVDAALHVKLSKLREFGSVRSLPVPLEDLQLAAGCGADENACLQLMAQQLEAGALLVRQLAAEPDGSLTLTLLVQDQALEQGEAWRAQGVLRSLTSEDIDRTLQHVLAQLFPQSVALASEPSLRVASRDRDAPDRRWRAGWTLSALGVGLLAAGLTSGLLSRRDERAFGRTDITTEQDVDHAQSAFARADRRARLATFFASTGAVVTTVGVGTLLWRWAALRSDAASSPRGAAASEPVVTTATVRVQPTGAGAMLMLDGAWRGGW